MIGSASAWIVGVLEGMRHALEPDHVAAVSTIVAEDRTGKRGTTLALLWGLGHGLMLLLVGGLLAVLRTAMPPGASDLFELGVAVMLIGLGCQALRRAYHLGTRGTVHTHYHSGVEHTHGGSSDHIHVRGFTLARRPLWVGLMHGLAGSGALTALVFARVSTVRAGLLLIALYGVGAAIGMAALAGVAGVAISNLLSHRRSRTVLLFLTGTFSLVLGVKWALPIAVRWFSA